MVTVSSESKSSPVLFPLKSCGNSLLDKSEVTLGCLARDFLPGTIDFSWDYKNNSAIDSKKIKTFQPLLSAGKYVASSQVLLPSVDLTQDGDDYVVCKVQHSIGNQKLNVTFGVPLELPPNVSVYIPPRDSFAGIGQRTSKLICQATGFSPKQISLSWLQEGRLLQSGFITGSVQPELHQSGPQTYQVTSTLTITESDWLNQNVFTCLVRHRGLEIKKNVSSVCGVNPSTGIRVFTIAPSFADIFLTKSAKIVCLVTDLTSYDSLDISWTRQNGEPLKTNWKVSESHPNDTFSAKGEATVCVEDWESGETFTCTVTHTDLPSPIKKTITKSMALSKHAPSIYLMPPTREQLSLRESASITCLMKGFAPKDVFVQWMQKGQLVDSDRYVTSSPMPEPQVQGYYFAFSILTVSEEDWSAGDTFTCVVGHEALPHLVTERTVDKSTGKPSLYNVSLVMSDMGNTCY